MDTTAQDFQSLLEELDNWWQVNEPEFYQNLNPGVTPEELDTAEVHLGFALPADFRALYSWHNGQNESQSRFGHANSIWQGEWHTLNEVLKDWYLLNTLLADHDYPDLPPDFGGKANWWSSDWLPFLYVNADFLCLDTKGFFGGKPGQIIQYLHVDDFRTVEYADLYHWLHTTLRIIQTKELYDSERMIYRTTAGVDELHDQLNPGYPWFFPHMEGFPPQS